MTDQTPQATNPKPSSGLNAADQAALETLTATKDSRYRADAQSQQTLERLRAWTRTLFKREDGRQWRESKTKLLGFVVLGVAAFAFWNYYPRPQISGIGDVPALSVGAPPDARKDTSSSLEPSVKRPTPLEVAPPPKLPAPQISANPSSLGSVPEAAPISVTENALPAADPSPSSAFSTQVDLPRAPSFTGYDPSFQPSTRSLEQPANSTRTPPRVAPVPTPLVEKPVTSSQAPKPLLERDETVATAQSKPLTLEGDGTAETVPPISARYKEAGFSLGEAGALVDATATRPDSPTVPGVLFDASSSASTSSSNPNAGSSAPPAASAFQAGMRVTAKLTVGVIAAQGQDSPVIAQLEDGTMVLGKASLVGSKVQIAVLEVVKENVSSAVNGSVIGADGFPGIATELREDSPDVVGKLWQAGLQGVSSYAQSVVQGTTTTVLNGATSVSSPQPNIGLSLLQSLAQTFLAPQGQPSVKYARLEPGAAFQVLFLPAK